MMLNPGVRTQELVKITGQESKSTSIHRGISVNSKQTVSDLDAVGVI